MYIYDMHAVFERMQAVAVKFIHISSEILHRIFILN